MTHHGEPFGDDPPGHVSPGYPPPRPGCAGCLISLVTGALSLAVIAFCIGYLTIWGPREARATWVDPTGLGPQAFEPKTPLGILQAALTAQSKALLAGDEQGWMSIVDPGNAELVASYRNQFRALRGLRVTRWYQTIIPKRGSEQTATLSVYYCLGDTTCKQGAERGDGTDPAATVRSLITWTISNGQARVVRAGPTGDSKQDRSPLRSDLVTGQGQRVVVAAPPGLASHVPKAVAAGDAAAALVDPLARYYQPPDRYVLYLAGSEEYGSWFGNAQPMSAGFTIASRHNPQMVINLGYGWLDQMPSVIRHEMGHVVTLQNTRSAEPLWLVEGIAEYIEHHGQTLAQTGARPQARAYVKAGGWDGHIAIDFGTRKLDDVAAEDAGRYALSYLAVRCIADTYGEDRLFTLFDTVVRTKKKELPAAAGEVLGAPWDVVDQRCAAGIRSSIG